tara:strand:+ start:1300 stop:1731 length:432 start_codon:yes stop_codon:yes gene_type:complete
MIKKLNFQYVLSYLGLIPFFILIFDKYFLYKIKEEIVISFLIYYILIIFVFVGSINWNLKVKLKLHIIIYGFLPSLFTTIIIAVNFYYFNQLFILLAIIVLILIQLLADYLIIYMDDINKHSFFYLRLPLTLIIILCSLIIIS